MKFIYLLLTCCLAFFAVSAEQVMEKNWRDKALQDKAWQQYFARSAQLLALDQQQLKAELKQLKLTTASKPIKAKQFGFLTDPPASYWASPEAVQVAKVILSFQTPSGGWSKRTDMTRQVRQPGQLYGTEHDYIPTFDNDATTTQIRWLSAFYPYADGQMQPLLQSAVERGIAFIVQAQYPNGGFAQSYPLQGGYHDAITLNDNAMVQLLRLLRDVAQNTEFAFVAAPLKQQAAQSFDLGVELLLKAQLVLNGELTVWSAQHHPLTLAAVKARAYELASLVSSESAEVTLLLMQLPQPSAQVIASVEAAVHWFAVHQIKDTLMQRSEQGVHFVKKSGAKPLWARFYDLEHQQPLFVDRDGNRVASMADLSLERQNGYGWYQSNADSVLKAYPGWKKRVKALTVVPE